MMPTSSKLIRSEAEQRETLVIAGYGRHRPQRVKEEAHFNTKVSAGVKKKLKDVTHDHNNVIKIFVFISIPLIYFFFQ